MRRFGGACGLCRWVFGDIGDDAGVANFGGGSKAVLFPQMLARRALCRILVCGVRAAILRRKTRARHAGFEKNGVDFRFLRARTRIYNKRKRFDRPTLEKIACF